MAHTRARRAAELNKRRPSAKDQGTLARRPSNTTTDEWMGGRPRGISRRRSERGKKTRHVQKRHAPKPADDDRTHLALENTSSRQNLPTPVQSRRRKRSIDDASDPSLDSRTSKRLRTSPIQPHAENTLGESVAGNRIPDDPIDPVSFWAREGRWPEEEELSNMERLLARKKSLTSLGRKRSNSATSTTPSDEKPREEKSAQYRDPRYKTLLATKGSFMNKSDLGITDASKVLCKSLLEEKQTVPRDSLFRDDIFDSTCRRVEDRNEARVVRDISPLIIPPAEILAIYGATDLECLIESTNEGWNNSIPLTGTRPQPDYSVGFRREAFTEDQLEKLSPFIGDWISGDLSYFMATYYMYFPFLTCEVKCGAAALDIADRQNAHSMTLAARAIVELFRLAKREKELHRQILTFSISHDHQSARIYGYYPVIDGKNTKYYRHPIRNFSFTELDGKEKWAAYQFTKNVYQSWMPGHFKRIRSAIDQLPSDLDFGVPSLEKSGLSQSLESHHLSQPDADTPDPIIEDRQSSSADQQGFTPDTSLTGQGSSKRRKAQSRGVDGLAHPSSPGTSR